MKGFRWAGKVWVMRNELINNMVYNVHGWICQTSIRSGKTICDVHEFLNFLLPKWKFDLI